MRLFAVYAKIFRSVIFLMKIMVKDLFIYKRHLRIINIYLKKITVFIILLISLFKKKIGYVLLSNWDGPK